jgi:hypothetical protein
MKCRGKPTMEKFRIVVTQRLGPVALIYVQGSTRWPDITGTAPVISPELRSIGEAEVYIDALQSNLEAIRAELRREFEAAKATTVPLFPPGPSRKPRG